MKLGARSLYPRITIRAGSMFKQTGHNPACSLPLGTIEPQSEQALITEAR